MKELEKSKIHILIEIIGYEPNSVVSKTIIRKITGSISILALDNDEVLAEKISPFDTFVQIIEGAAEISIENETSLLKVGEGLIIPAHSSHIIKANGRFKMISTIIKSGYEGILI